MIPIQKSVTQRIFTQNAEEFSPQPSKKVLSLRNGTDILIQCWPFKKID